MERSDYIPAQVEVVCKWVKLCAMCGVVCVTDETDCDMQTFNGFVLNLDDLCDRTDASLDSNESGQ